VEAAVRGADLIVTATSAPEPIVQRAWVAAGAHINAVDAFTPTTRELVTMAWRWASAVDCGHGTDFLGPPGFSR